jgi:hypothetical protein
MPSLICSVCKQEFAYKSYLLRHMKSVQCYSTSDSLTITLAKPIIITQQEVSCSSCTFKTKHKSNLYRHRKTCPSIHKAIIPPNTAQITNNQELIQQLIKENQELKAKMQVEILEPIQTISSHNTNTVNLTINNNSNNTDNSTNTINTLAAPIDLEKKPGYKYINPVGCEDLSFITEEQLDYIYMDTDNSTAKLLDIIYSKRENRNFTKDNVNKPDMKYYSKRLQVDYMQEYDFIEQLTQQRMLNFHLRLIHTFKHKISLEKFTNYFRRIITIERIFDDFDIEAAKSKTHSSAIKSIINQLSRDKRITRDMCEFFKLIEENAMIKAETEARIRFYQQLESSAVVEYETREKQQPMLLLSEQRNLYHFKKLFINQAMLDQQALYDRKALL